MSLNSTKLIVALARQQLLDLGTLTMPLRASGDDNTGNCRIPPFLASDPNAESVDNHGKK